MGWTPPTWQARRYLVAFDATWALWAVAGIVTLAAGRNAAAVLLLPAVPATAYSQGLGYKIEGGDATAFRPLDTFGVAGHRLSLPTHLRAQINMLRPRFVRDVATVSGWHVGRAVNVAATLFLANLVLFVTLLIVGPAS